MQTRIALILFFLLVVPNVGCAAGPDDSLRAYGVGVNGGAGIYLGNGLVLSVAHVVGGGIVNKPTVIIAGPFTGNSGWGLFDAQRNGIMSRKLSQVRVNRDTGENVA